MMFRIKVRLVAEIKETDFPNRHQIPFRKGYGADIKGLAECVVRGVCTHLKQPVSAGERSLACEIFVASGLTGSGERFFFAKGLDNDKKCFSLQGCQRNRK